MTNPAFVPRWLAAGLRAAAHGSDGDLRAFELPSLRFFVATLFQPQFSSSFERPHPIIEGYLRACAGAATVATTASNEASRRTRASSELR